MTSAETNAETPRRINALATLAIAACLLVLIPAGALFGWARLVQAENHRPSVAGEWMEDSERSTPDSYPEDSAIKYQIARSLLDSYGGHRIRLLLSDTPCGNSTFYGCTNGFSPGDVEIEINTSLDYSNLAKTVSHEYAHSLNTGALTGKTEVRLFTGHVIFGVVSRPDEVLADCASQILTDFQYPWVIRSYLASECTPDQLSVARRLLSGEFIE